MVLIKGTITRFVGASLVAGAALVGCGGGDEGRPPPTGSADADSNTNFSDPTHIDNPFLPLSRYSVCVFADAEGDTRLRIIRRLLARTEPFEVEGRPVDAAVVEDSEFEDGELVERTLDYFAQSDDRTVYYFGEDVDDYEDGRIVGHDGQWRLGRDTDTPGVLMPGNPQPGAQWRAEDVPGITLESDEAVEILETVDVAGKTYEQVLRVRERSRPGHLEYKLYARGVGLIQELPGEGHIDLRYCR